MLTTPIRVPRGWPDHLPEYIFPKKKSICYYLRRIFSSIHNDLEIHVEKRLKRRTCDLDDLWRDYPELINTAKELQRALKKQLWGFEPVYAPFDSYLLIGQVLTGDLCEVEALMEIEEIFGVKINLEDSIVQGDMLGIVDYIDKMKMKNE
ncbi:MAG: hypothetical protein EOM12_13910 [Verrucomicrobiae bacterium]|nr:hypothetical protein [Verrucomicrobiae bacterium]